MKEDKDEIEFSYEVFDRQLDNFCRMLSIDRKSTRLNSSHAR